MVASIWATINKTEVPRVVQTFKKVNYNEGLVHDIFVGKMARSKRIGSFMESSLFIILLKNFGLSQIIVDVNFKNHASLRMHDKLGIKVNHKMFYVSKYPTYYQYSRA